MVQDVNGNEPRGWRVIKKFGSELSLRDLNTWKKRAQLKTRVSLKTQQFPSFLKNLSSILCLTTHSIYKNSN